MSLTYLKEVTDWGTYDYVPNHTYIVNAYQQLVGYIKQGTTEEIMFSKPFKQWSKSKRKFIEIKVNNA